MPQEEGGKKGKNKKFKVEMKIEKNLLFVLRAIGSYCMLIFAATTILLTKPLRFRFPLVQNEFLVIYFSEASREAGQPCNKYRDLITYVTASINLMSYFFRFYASI